MKNEPASTFEKCGGTIAKGPRFINHLVEEELAMYKKEVEEKFLTSVMNNSYVFHRKASPISKPLAARS